MKKWKYSELDIREGEKSKKKKEKTNTGKREMASVSAAAQRHRLASSPARQHELPICQH